MFWQLLHKPYSGFLLILTVLVLAGSCKKREDTFSDFVNSTAQSRSLKVTVSHVYEVWPQVKDSTVPNAIIRIYKSQEERDNDLFPEIFGKTDSAGVLQFTQMNEEYYYLVIRHPIYGETFEEIKTPGGTLSFLEVRYY